MKHCKQIFDLDLIRELADKGNSVNQVMRVLRLSSDKPLRTAISVSPYLVEKFRENGMRNKLRTKDKLTISNRE